MVVVVVDLNQDTVRRSRKSVMVVGGEMRFFNQTQQRWKTFQQKS
jgi:hypothetical protein